MILKLWRKSIFIGFIFILIFPFDGIAQNNGTIRGKVINKSTGEPVIGVNIQLKGTNNGNATDLDGKFEISAKPGTYDIKLSYVSLQNTVIEDVKVQPGGVNLLGNIQMAKSSVDMKGATVRAERVKNSEQAMLTLKKQSSNVIDGISAEKFKQTGDGNAAEAMKRVSGVSIEEGQYVYVRGLGGRYTQTTLNGVSLPGLDPNRNALQMDIFPTNVISNMVVSKTFTADQPAGFTGGLVNIETKDFPGKQTFKVSASVGYNPDMHFNEDYLTYPGSKTDFLGFDDGTRAIPTNRNKDVPFEAETYTSEQKEQQFTNILNNFNPTLAAENRKSFMDFSLSMGGGNQFSKNGIKIGYNYALTYENTTKYYDNVEFNAYGKPNDNSEYKLEPRELQKGGYGKNSVLLGGLGGIAVKTEQSKYKFNVLRLQNGNSKAGVYDYTNSDEGAVFQAKQHNLEYNQRSLTNLLLNGTHYKDQGNWKFDWKLSPTFSNVKAPDIRYTRIRAENGRYTVGSESGIPQRIWRFLEEENYSAKVDVEKGYQFNGNDASLKFGGSNTYKQRDYQIQAFGITPQNGVKIDGAEPEDFNSIMADSNLWTPSNRDGTVYKPNFVPNNPNQYNASSNNTALYVSNEFKPFKRLNAITGLRVENFTQNYTGYDPVTNETIDETVLDALDLFPSVNLNYEITGDQNLRLSYSRTIARPSFKEASKATIFDPINGKTYIGGLIPSKNQNTGNIIWDGDLSETRVNNFDLRWEWFQKHQQMISLSTFYKTFDDPIELVQLSQATNNIQPRNVGDGEVIGVEVELRQNLSRIFKGLNAFSFSTNVTFTESRIDIGQNELASRRSTAREGKNVDETRKMAGQAPYIINTGVAYKGENNGLEAGIYYNVQGPTLQIVGINDRPDVYSDPFHRLKFNASKTLGKEDQFDLGLKVSNILGDQKAKVFRAFKEDDQYYRRMNPGTTFSLSFGYNFK